MTIQSNRPAHTPEHKSKLQLHQPLATQIDPSCSLHNATDHVLYWMEPQKRWLRKGPKRKHGVAVFGQARVRTKGGGMFLLGGHTHVPVCICSNVRHFSGTAWILWTPCFPYFPPCAVVPICSFFSGGHEATDTGLAYAPVSQAHGHHPSVQCFALLHCSADQFSTTPGGL